MQSNKENHGKDVSIWFGERNCQKKEMYQEHNTVGYFLQDSYREAHCLYYISERNNCAT